MEMRADIPHEGRVDELRLSPIRSGRGLSQVVTTLILLVVAVLLTSTVTYYATNITMEDIGTACSITVFTVNGQYIVECMVESAT